MPNRIATCSWLVSWYSSSSTWFKAVGQFFCQHRLGDHLRPEQQQVVVVQHTLGLLGFDVAAEKRLQLAFADSIRLGLIGDSQQTAA